MSYHFWNKLVIFSIWQNNCLLGSPTTVGMSYVFWHPDTGLPDGRSAPYQMFVRGAIMFFDHISSGGASAVKKPGHFEVKKSSSQVRYSLGVHFFSSKSWRPFLVVALKTQAANAADWFTVKIKQIQRSDMVTFLFSVHTITEAKQYAGRRQGGGSSSQVIWLGAPWCSAATAYHYWIP